MDAEAAVSSIEQLLKALDIAQDITGQLIVRVRDAETRCDELAGDVAELGTRVSELERERRNEHSLTVVGRERFRTLDELATVLRAEVADEVAAITQRIDSVHERALRALTDLSKKGTPA